ncbi:MULTISPECIES: redoxin domain-containing protein [Chitinophagaceae]
MKRKYILGIALMGIVSFTHAQKKETAASTSNLIGPSTVTVNVTALPDKNGRFFLRSGHLNDSAKITDNKLVFKNDLNEPQVAYLMYYPASDSGKDLNKLRAQRKNIYPFYLTTGQTTITIKDSVQAAHLISPNTYQKEYEAIDNQQRSFEKTQMIPLITRFYTAREQGDQATAIGLSRQLDSLSTVEKETIFRSFISEKAATSPVALSVLTQYIGSSLDLATVKPLFDKLNPEYQGLPTGIALQTAIEQETSRLQQEKASEIGQEAPDFTQNDTTGHPISLKDFRGKYVLVDFWASWCPPCRGENPNVVAAFKKYHDKNFTILGVSFDKNKSSWLDAIHEDGLTWNHVSDLQYWNNAVGKIYGIQSIPANILIDPNGKIIAKDIRGEVLQETLRKIFE